MEEQSPMSDPIQVRFPIDLLQIMDEEIKLKRFRSRPAFIRAVVEESLLSNKEKEKLLKLLQDPEIKKAIREIIKTKSNNYNDF